MGQLPQERLGICSSDMGCVLPRGPISWVELPALAQLATVRMANRTLSEAIEVFKMVFMILVSFILVIAEWQYAARG